MSGSTEYSRTRSWVNGQFTCYEIRVDCSKLQVCRTSLFASIQVSTSLSLIYWREQRLVLSCCLILQTCLSTLNKLVFPWPTWALTYEIHSFCWPPAPVQQLLLHLFFGSHFSILNLKCCKAREIAARIQ